LVPAYYDHDACPHDHDAGASDDHYGGADDDHFGGAGSVGHWRCCACHCSAQRTQSLPRPARGTGDDLERLVGERGGDVGVKVCLPALPGSGRVRHNLFSPDRARSARPPQQPRAPLSRASTRAHSGLTWLVAPVAGLTARTSLRPLAEQAAFRLRFKASPLGRRKRRNTTLRTRTTATSPRWSGRLRLSSDACSRFARLAHSSMRNMAQRTSSSASTTRLATSTLPRTVSHLCLH
jgi:hypothetical protein